MSKEVQAGADCDAVAADRSGNREWEDDPPNLSRGGDHRADLLSLAEGVRGLKLNQSKRLMELEKENARLKRLVAELVLEKQVLRDVAEGNF